MISSRHLFVQTFFPKNLSQELAHAFASVHMQLHKSNLGISSQDTGMLLTNLIRRGNLHTLMVIRGEIILYMIVVKAQNCLVWSYPNIIKFPSALATFFVPIFGTVQSVFPSASTRTPKMSTPSPVKGEKNQSPNSTIWEDPFSMFCTWAAQPPVLCASSGELIPTVMELSYPSHCCFTTSMP